MKTTPPNEFRSGSGMFATTSADGMNGYFRIPLPDRGHKVIADCIVSDGEDWEHVSVHITEFGKQRTPTWDEMCVVKDLFWQAEETVVQYHPAKSDYVNTHPHVLHLWRPTNGGLPNPPLIFV